MLKLIFILLMISVLHCTIMPANSPPPPPLKPLLQLQNFVRSYDGTNNNVANPNWGSVGEPLQRIGTPNYIDGLGIPLTSGKPNVRNVSNILDQVIGNVTDDNQNRSMIAVIFGQFINHDINLVPTQVNGETMPISVPQCDAHLIQIVPD